MTEDEAYNVAYKCFEYYNDKDTTLENWTSPASVESKVGVVSYDWMSGSSVTKNIVELFEALDSNGINTWICSAGETDAVRAAVDFWGLHGLNHFLGYGSRSADTDEYISSNEHIRERSFFLLKIRDFGHLVFDRIHTLLASLIDSACAVTKRDVLDTA